jgi:hypothetical protein
MPLWSWQAHIYAMRVTVLAYFLQTTTNMAVTGVHARMIYDSRGNPTVEVDLTTAKGEFDVILATVGMPRAGNEFFWGVFRSLC